MKKSAGIFFISLLSLLSCTTYKAVKLPVLVINGKWRNGKIVNRFPDYGDGHRDGCITMREMRIEIWKSDYNKHFSGLVKDVATSDVLHNANITFQTADGQRVQTMTDRDGKFSVVMERPAISVTVNYIAYRRFYALFQ